MNEKRASSPLTGPAIAAAVFLALLVPYVAGYLMLGNTGTGGTILFRIYNRKRPRGPLESQWGR